MITSAAARLGLGIAGVVAAALAVLLDSRPLAWGAVGVLGVAVLLRVADRRRRRN